MQHYGNGIFINMQLSEKEILNNILTCDGVGKKRKEEYLNELLKRRNEELIKALKPFAAMHREGCLLTEVACIRGVASDMTMITSEDFANAYNALKKF